MGVGSLGSESPNTLPHGGWGYTSIVQVKPPVCMAGWKIFFLAEAVTTVSATGWGKDLS